MSIPVGTQSDWLFRTRPERFIVRHHRLPAPKRLRFSGRNNMAITAKFQVQNIRTTKTRDGKTVRERLTLAGPSQTALTFDLAPEAFGTIKEGQTFDVTLSIPAEAKS